MTTTLRSNSIFSILVNKLFMCFKRFSSKSGGRGIHRFPLSYSSLIYVILYCHKCVRLYSNLVALNILILFDLICGV